MVYIIVYVCVHVVQMDVMFYRVDKCMLFFVNGTWYIECNKTM